MLRGTEVKTLRAGKVTLRDAYAEARGGEFWLQNAHVPEYLPGGRIITPRCGRANCCCIAAKLTSLPH